MKEDLNIQGTDFNVRERDPTRTDRWQQKTQKINTIFTCGYIVGMIPSWVHPSLKGATANLAHRQSNASSCRSEDLVSRHANSLGGSDLLVGLKSLSSFHPTDWTLARVKSIMCNRKAHSYDLRSFTSIPYLSCTRSGQFASFKVSRNRRHSSGRTIF